MFRRPIFARFTALFVVAFVCLNAGGVVCVAYCKGFDRKAEKEHCPLQKLSKHCNKVKDQYKGSNAINTPDCEMDCCPFTANIFIAAPIESSKASADLVAATPVQNLLTPPTFAANPWRNFIDIAYRGPPLDRRIDRLKNCIIRI